MARKTWTKRIDIFSKNAPEQLRALAATFEDYAKEMKQASQRENRRLSQLGAKYLTEFALDAREIDTGFHTNVAGVQGGNQYGYYFYPVGAGFEFLEYGTGVKVGKGTYLEGVVKNSPKRVPYGTYGQGKGSQPAWVFPAYLANMSSPFVWSGDKKGKWAVTSGFPAQAPFARATLLTEIEWRESTPRRLEQAASRAVAGR